MERKHHDPGNPVIGLAALVAIGAIADYMINDGQNIVRAIEWYYWLKSLVMPTTQHQATVVAPTAMQSLNLLAGIFLVVVGVVVALRWMGNSFNARKEATTPTLGAVPIRRNRGHLSRKFPADICRVVEDVLTTRSGVADDGGPKFWIERDNCIATPLYWRLAVDYAPGVDPAALNKMVSNINDRLIRRDLDADAIVDPRPLSIIINNPKPPTFALADYWKLIANLPQDDLLCAGSVIVEQGQMTLCRLHLGGEGAGTLIAGRPGAGKTQFALSTLLSLCMANSPQRLSLFIADIKKLDTMHLASLPHLAAPIATEANQVADILAAMVKEMMRRSRVSDRDRTWEDHAVVIYIDELATLLSLAGERKAEIIENINNLARTGRALGMIVIAATQRVVEIDTEVFTNLSRRCVLRCQKVTDSNHAIGAKETNGHKLPKGAVSIHDAGDSDGELTRGLFVGETTKGFDRVIGPFLADIKKRHANQAPAFRLPNPNAAIAIVDLADEPADDDPDLVPLAMEQLVEVREKYGDALVATWIELASTGALTANTIRRPTKVNGQIAQRIRSQIERVVNLVKNTHISESPV